jgi:proline dehydrogenase
VDRNYVELMNLLLETGVYPAIATHDEKIIEQTKRFVESRKIARDSVRIPDALRHPPGHPEGGWLTKDTGCGLYVPYGQAWYPYFMRRLAERPANVLFLARNLLRS